MARAEQQATKPKGTDSERTRTHQIVERVRKVDPKDAAVQFTKGVGAVLPPLAFGGELVAGLFDHSDADAVKTIGDSHLKTAQDALRDAQQTPDNAGLVQTAETSLRTAYGLCETELGRRDVKVLAPILSKKDTAAAHRQAAETALAIAALNTQEGRLDNLTAQTWADNARGHFEEYATLAEKSANGKLRTNEDRLAEIAGERQTFESVYSQLVPPLAKPSSQ